MAERTRKQKILLNAIVPISTVPDAKKHHQGKNAHYIVPCWVACLEFHSFDHPTFGQWVADKSPVLSLFHLHKSEYTETQNFICNNFINSPHIPSNQNKAIMSTSYYLLCLFPYSLDTLSKNNDLKSNLMWSSHKNLYQTLFLWFIKWSSAESLSYRHSIKEKKLWE